MKEKILHADPSYLDRLNGFTRTDTLIATGYYVLILIVYYIMGSVLTKTGKYYGVFVNIAFILIPVFICRGLYALGLCRNNLCRSLIVSGITGIVFLLAVTIIPGTLSHAQLLPPDRIVTNLFYYFIVIALSEEISFRGFIQPRLFPLVKREWLTILLGGVLFVRRNQDCLEGCTVCS